MAKQRNTSIAELIRRGIDLLLQEAPVEEDPAYRMIGLVSSGVKEADHDEHIVQEIEKEWRT